MCGLGLLLGVADDVAGVDGVVDAGLGEGDFVLVWAVGVGGDGVDGVLAAGDLFACGSWSAFHRFVEGVWVAFVYFFSCPAWWGVCFPSVVFDSGFEFLFVVGALFGGGGGTIFFYKLFDFV